MTWVRIDDELPGNEKVDQAGLEAMGAWLLAGAWSSKRGTDGFIPTATALKIAPLRVWHRLRDAKARHEHGLFEERPDGWQMHDFLDYNPSAREVEAERLRKGKNLDDHRKRKRLPKPRATVVATGDETGRATGFKPGEQPGRNHGPDPDPVPGEILSPGVGAVPGFPGGPPDAPGRDECPEAQAAAAEDAEATPRSRPQPDPADTTWRRAYAAKHGRYVGIPQDDERTLLKAMRAARAIAAECQPDGDRETGARLLFAHWVACYLADPGTRGWLDENKHPLGSLLRDVAKYGTPWDGPARDTSNIVDLDDEPDGPPPMTPAEIAAAASGIGRGAQA